MKKSRKLFVILTCLAAVVFCSGAVIWARPSASVTNTFDTGVVQIDLEEYQLNEQGEEIPWEDNPVILPGMKISKIPRISNCGNACYVRAKAVFKGTEALDISCLYGISGDWIKAEDGYYYYRQVLGQDESVDFFSGLEIPVDFSQDEEGAKIELDIQVDAIQSRNVTPDFESDSPWGEVEILEAENTEAGEMRVVQTQLQKKFVVEYQGEAAKLVINEENFFGNIPTLLPGDEYTDGAKLINNSSQPVRLYFRSRVEDESDLTDKIQLVIETETDGKSKVIYEGPLRADDLKEDTLLMTIPAGSAGRMVFAIYVPAELDNAYTLRDEAVQWIFSTEEVVSPNKAVDTGDSRKTGGYMMLAGLSLGFAVRMIQRKRRTDEREA